MISYIRGTGRLGTGQGNRRCTGSRIRNLYAGAVPEPFGPIGCEVKIHTYLNVREDAMQLFGFLTRDDLEVFRLVIGVSGIGPKGGLNILSCLSADELKFAVLSGDAKAICAAPGIGKEDSREADKSN